MSDFMKLLHLGQNIPTAEDVNLHFQPVLDRYKEKEQEALQSILSTAQSGLSTGDTWRMADRIEVLKDALEDIVKICQEQMKDKV